MKNLIKLNFHSFIGYWLIGISLFFNSQVWATSEHLQDEAKVVNTVLKEKLEQLAHQLETKNGLYLKQIILSRFRGDPTAHINSLIVHLNQETTHASQILIVIELESHFSQIYVSENLRAIFTPQVLKDINANIIKQMNEKDYDQMARIAFAGIYHYYNHTPAKSFSLFNLSLFALGLLLIFLLVKRKT